MSNIYINFIADSGGTYFATVERLVDNYFREDDTETFSAGLAVADKDVILTEGSGENRGSYSKTLTGDTWNDGLYKVRIHDSNDNNNVVGSSLFGVVAGKEVVIGEEVAIYHADINFFIDEADTTDRYMITWFKNGVRITSGITSPTIQVIDKDGNDLIGASALTAVGATGTYIYNAITTARQTVGDPYIVIATATIDSSSRSYSWILGRDSTA